jgi:hypothetical protein
MTKKNNNGSSNQNSPTRHQRDTNMASGMISGDNSKGNKRNKDQKDKTD